MCCIKGGGIVRDEELEWVNLDGNLDASEGNYDEVMLMPWTISSSHEMSFGIIESEQHNVGVNGFGNVPLAIQLKRIVSGGHGNAERERRRWLDGVLSQK